MTDRRRRERHPARSARILVTGAAISATLGLTSAFRVAEVRASQTDPADGTQAADTGATGGTTPVAAPTTPAPAVPVDTVVPDTSTPSVAPVPATVTQPAVVVVPELRPQWTPPATSGSN